MLLQNSSVPQASYSPVMENTPPTTGLLDLPVEVVTNILSYLPPSEIQRTCRTCRDVQNIVDEDTNKTLLFFPQISQSLLHSTQSVLEYDPELPFVEALINFFHHRRIQAQETVRFHELFAFAAQWITRRESRLNQNKNNRNHRRMEIVQFTRKIVNLHVQLHHPNLEFEYETARVPTDFNGFIHCISGDASSVAGMNQTAVEELYRSIRYDGLMSNLPVLPKHTSKGEHLPSWPLTRVHAIAMKSDMSGLVAVKRAGLDGCCSLERLEELLEIQLPALPPAHFFAYCVEHGWAYEMVKRGLEQGHMDRRSRAIVLEDMLLY